MTDEYNENLGFRIAGYAANNFDAHPQIDTYADYESRKKAYETKKSETTPEEHSEKRKSVYQNKKSRYRDKKAESEALKAAVKFQIAKEKQQSGEQSPILIKLSGVFFVFTIICLFTWAILCASSGNIVKADIPSTGSTIGPVNITKDNYVYEINVSRPVLMNQSSYVSGNVLDQNKKMLFGFGKDVWDEDGTDNEGYYWRETKTNYGVNITFPKKGQYYLEFESEDESTGQFGTIHVELIPKIASSLAFLWLSIISFITTICLFGYYIFKNSCKDTSIVNFGKKVLEYLFYAALFALGFWAEM